MITEITNFITEVNDVLWSTVLLFALCGAGVFFTVRLRFIQLRKFKDAWRVLFRRHEDGKKDGEMTPVQALATAVAAQVGTGNLAGAATAIVSGGPGAIFWMWVSAFFGMATVYAEATLAQKFRREEHGEITGGPAYYIREAFGGAFGKILACVFAVCCCCALGFTGIMVQANSIGSAFSGIFEKYALPVPALAVGAVVALAAGAIFFGGTRRLAKAVVRIVPLMALVYIVGSVILIAANAAALPEAVRLIFVGAFDPQAAMGGALGVTVREAIRYGVARGLFSNEAGMGSTPHAHARAAVKNPNRQGLIAMLSVFIDTFVILNLTVFVILTSGALKFGEGAARLTGIDLTQAAFDSLFTGFGGVFVAVCLFFFAFSTILGWHFFGAVNFAYLTRGRWVKLYSAVVLAFVVAGTLLKVECVWQLADFFNGLMVLPNLLALVVLSKTVSDISKGRYVELPKN